MPPTHAPTIHPMSIKDISMFLYRKQIFVILPFHFSWLNWVRKCCSISADFCIVYSRSTYRPSDHAYCQLYQFIMLTFHPFWQSHSMESNRSSSSINSYTFISNTLISLIEAIYYIISLSSIIPISTVLSITISLEHSNSFFISTMPLIWFHFINSYSSINFFQFLLIPWVSLIPSIPPFPFHQFNSSCFIRSISTIIFIVSNHRIQQFHQIIQFHQLQQVNQYSKWSLFCQFFSLYNYY